MSNSKTHTNNILQLPTKEASLFKQVLKMYEFKQYKRGLKQTEQILRKFPSHNDTLALKALFYFHLEKKEDAYKIIQKTLSQKSYICHHIHGIILRADKKYKEAIESFVVASKLDPLNIQILRDIVVLQMQLKEYEQALFTYYTIFKNNPHNKANWFGLCVALVLNKMHHRAIELMDIYEEGLDFNPTLKSNKYEYSEIQLFKLEILKHKYSLSKNNDILLKMLEFIKKKESMIIDRISMIEYKAESLYLIGEKEESTIQYLQLLKHNQDNPQYLNGILMGDGLLEENLNQDDMKRGYKLLKDLQREYPKSLNIKFKTLNYADDMEFEQEIKDIIIPLLRRGVPSLFSSIKHLYKNETKLATIQKIMHEIYDYFNNGTKVPYLKNELQCVYLWTLYFLSKHYDYIKEYKKALFYINLAIQHTPTLIELFMTKAKILKHQGLYHEAFLEMERAREHDLQDRYVNSKAAKYTIRNKDPKKAREIVELFIRPDCKDKIVELTEMQCVWYFHEMAKLSYENKDYKACIDTSEKIIKFFDEYVDDEFDFHTYCLRKCTLRAYTNMLHNSTQIRQHPYFIKTCSLYLQCCLSMSETGCCDSLDTKMKQLEINDPLEKARSILKLVDHKKCDSEISELGVYVYIKSNKLMMALMYLKDLIKYHINSPAISYCYALLKERDALLINNKDIRAFYIAQIDKTRLFLEKEGILNHDSGYKTPMHYLYAAKSMFINSKDPLKCTHIIEQLYLNKNKFDHKTFLLINQFLEDIGSDYFTEFKRKYKDSN